jgi:hypothetical protein
LNRQFTLDGLAWHYVWYSKAEALAAAEREARAAGRGFWAGREPVPPWEWRGNANARPCQRVVNWILSKQLQRIRQRCMPGARVRINVALCTLGFRKFGKPPQSPERRFGKTDQ